MARIHPKKIHILVANASEAKSYETQHLGRAMHLLKEYNHPESRERDQDLISDRAGQFNTSVKAHVSSSTHSTPKAIEADNFARELANELNHTTASCGSFDELVVIAPARFYGMLNKHCNEHVLSHLTWGIKKDYTKMAQKDLQQYLEVL